MDKGIYLAVLAIIILIVLAIVITFSLTKIGKESDNKINQLWNERNTKEKEDDSLKENRKE